MPLYEYRCTECGNRYEKIQKINDLQDTACPKCGGKVVRPLTAPALQFKGSGFYINDYAPKSSGGSGKAGSDGASSGDGSKAEGGSKSAESKPAATDSKSSGGDSGSSSGSGPASSSSTPAS